MKKAIIVYLPICIGVAAACSAGGGGSKFSGGHGGAGSGAGGSVGVGVGGINSGAGGTNVGPACDICEDFPSTPIFDTSTPPPPPNSAVLFGGIADSAPSGGPCLVEPQVGSLFPNNWFRLRFRYVPPAGQDLFEIRVHADKEKNDLVVYTTSTQWKMPKDIWQNLAAHVQDLPITVSVRSINSKSPGKPMLGVSGPITIAPVIADGSMVYWATVGLDPPDSKLAGFGVGQEGITDALTIPQVQQAGQKDQGGNPKPMNGAVACIGCHTSTPDGDSVLFTDHWPWGEAIASIKKDSVGQVPSYVTPGARENMDQPWLGVTTMSKAHWTAGDRIFITSYGRSSGAIWDGQTSTDQPSARLAWFDVETAKVPVPVSGSQLQALEGTAYGFITRTGDPSGAMVPNWSHDGQTIVYVSTAAGKDGRLGVGMADLYTVPYNNKAGGTAKPLQGAADPAYNEYYPTFSPDDKFVSFNRIAAGQDMYYNPTAEVYVIPAAGGAATRLVANDPPACTGLASPGLTNSWAKWAPETYAFNGKTYYWLIFSSTRDGFTIQKQPQEKASQLYMTAVVVDSKNTITTYPGVYIWNQDMATSNHTPAWDVINIPPPPPPK